MVTFSIPFSDCHHERLFVLKAVTNEISKKNIIYPSLLTKMCETIIQLQVAEIIATPALFVTLAL